MTSEPSPERQELIAALKEATAAEAGVAQELTRMARILDGLGFTASAEAFETVAHSARAISLMHGAQAGALEDEDYFSGE
jgi:hypothetical protein